MGVIAELYKEYRSLKEVTENSSKSSSGGLADQKTSKEDNSTSKVWQTALVTDERLIGSSLLCICVSKITFFLLLEYDCWGSHLNRKSLLPAAAKLTSQDRDNLQASSQYYGLKLKSNLAAFGKVKINCCNSVE